MRISKLAIFLSAVDHGSIRGAARALKLTQPAVTRTIRELETTLGVSLVDRSVEGISLTRYGKAFVARARRLMADYASALDEITQLKEGAVGTLRIGATGAMFLSFLPEALGAFQEMNPKVELVLFESSLAPLLTRVRQGSLDLALACVLEGQLGEEFVAIELGSLPMVLGVSTGHPLRESRRLAELRSATWLLPAEDPEGSPRCDAPLLSCLGLAKGARILRFQSLLPALALARGLTLVVPLEGALAKLGSEAFGLEELSLVDPLPSLKVCFIHRRDSPLIPTVALFSYCVQEAAAWWFTG